MKEGFISRFSASFYNLWVTEGVLSCKCFSLLRRPPPHKHKGKQHFSVSKGQQHFQSPGYSWVSLTLLDRHFNSAISIVGSVVALVLAEKIHNTGHRAYLESSITLHTRGGGKHGDMPSIIQNIITPLAPEVAGVSTGSLSAL